MKTNEAVRDRILRLCQEHDMTINRLATVSALPPSSIKNILYGKSRNPKLLTIKLICDGLGITLGQFFTAPEFDNLEQELEYNKKNVPDGPRQPRRVRAGQSPRPYGLALPSGELSAQPTERGKRIPTSALRASSE